MGLNYMIMSVQNTCMLQGKTPTNEHDATMSL